ncbi:MAG TPA: hypothetical protein VG937_23280 [Polyangiaceae bacterium]|nr:hypothetical protein [Polyangiaceae bacterium]
MADRLRAFAGRALALALALSLLLATLNAASQQRPRLIVYLHTSTRARALQTGLERQMPAVDVVVCSRHRDFVRELSQSPDAALALSPVLQAHGLEANLRGQRAGAESEAYVLLSIGSTIDKARFPSLVIGSVDLLGRDATAKLVANLLGLGSPPEIKYVIKSEDLLPLLQFGSADAVLLSEQEAQHIKTLSKLDLRATPLSARLGLAAVSFRSEAGRRLIRPSIEALDTDMKRRLGVDAWR